MKAILGKKIGMTQIFLDDGSLVPVTVVHAENKVVQKKIKEKDGYSALQVGYEDLPVKKACKAKQGHLKAAGSLLRHLKEIRLTEDIAIDAGAGFGVDVFEAGENVCVRGLTKGKGFAGYIKRHNFARGPMSHGSKSHRIGGSNAGQSIGVGSRTFKGKKMSGQMGNEFDTTTGVEVAAVDVEKNLLLLKGSIPGSNNGIVYVYTKKSDFDLAKFKVAEIETTEDAPATEEVVEETKAPVEEAVVDNKETAVESDKADDKVVEPESDDKETK